MVQANDPGRQRAWRTSLAIAAAVLLGVVSFAVPGLGPARPAPLPATPEDAETVGPSGLEAISQRSEGLRSRTDDSGETTPADEAYVPHATIVGRLIDQPVENIAFEIEVDAASTEPIPPNLSLVSSSSDGRFELSLRKPNPEASYTLRLSSGRTATHGVQLRRLAQRATVHLGDIPLTSSAPFRLEIVDEQGRPLPQLEVLVEEPIESLGLRDTIAQPKAIDPILEASPTDPNGRVDFGARHPATRIRDILDPSRSRLVEIVGVETTADGWLRVTASFGLPEISGAVVVPGLELPDDAKLAFVDPASGEPIFSVPLRGQHRFAARRPPECQLAELRPTLVLADDHRLRCAPDRIPVPSAGLQLVFEEDPGFHVFVTRPDGQPASDVTLVTVDEQGAHHFVADSKELEPGHYWMPSPAHSPDSTRLFAANFGRFPPSRIAAPNGRVFRLELPGWREQRFQIVDGQGTPLNRHTFTTYDLTGELPLGSMATTDAEGFATLQVPDRTDYAVRLLGLTFPIRLVEGAQPEDLQVLQLEHLTSIDISCRGFDRSAWPEGTRLELWLDFGRQHVGQSKLGPEDRTRIGLPTGRRGTIRAILEVPHGRSRRTLPVPGSDLSIQVAPGDHHVLDLTAVKPGSLAVEIPTPRPDHPFQQGRSGLVPSNAPTAGAFTLTLQPDRRVEGANGQETWIYERLPPGDYRARGQVPFAPHKITVQSGRRVQARVARLVHRAELQLTLANGEPIAGRRVQVMTHESIARRASMSTDERGRLVLEPAPLGKITVLLGEGPNQLRGSAVFAAGSEISRATIVLK